MIEASFQPSGKKSKTTINFYSGSVCLNQLDKLPDMSLISNGAEIKLQVLNLLCALLVPNGNNTILSGHIVSVYVQSLELAVGRMLGGICV